MIKTAPLTNGHTILVAEENSAEYAKIQAYLQESGYHCVRADPLETVVAQAAALKPAVILLNIAFAAVDALLVCQQLRAQSATQNIPIIFMIPLACITQRPKIFAYPLTDFILQPFEAQELAQRLAAQLPQVAIASRRSGFGQMLSATGVGLWEWDIRQNEVKWSSLAHSILGIPEDTFDGTFESYFSLVHNDDKAILATAIEQTLQDPHGYYQVEHRIVLPDGRQRWVEGRALVFKDEKDVPVRMMGTLVDITEQKNAFEALQKSQMTIERRSKTLSLINEIVNVVYQSLTASSIAKHTLEVMMAHAGVHSAVFYVLDESGKTLNLIKTAGLTDEFAHLGRKLPVENSFTGRAIQSRQLLISDEIGHDPIMIKEIQKILAALKITRVVSIPLIHNQQVLGAINVSFDDIREVDEQHTAMLLAVGKTVGMALDNANVLEKLESEVQERRRSEQAFHESEARYAAVIEQAQDGVLIAQDNIIQFVNRSYAEMVGYPMEELIGVPVSNLIAPEYRETVAEHHKARTQGREAPRIYEAQLVRKDGERLDVEISGGRITYEGAPASMALIRDITERKKAQEALYLSEAKFSAAFHTSADMVSISDINDGTFMVVNESSYNVVGYRPDELIGKSALDLGLWPDPSERARLVDLLKKNGTFHDEETIMGHKDGRLVNVSLSSSMLLIENTRYVLALIRDISDRKKAEATLRANEAMLRRTQKLARLGSWSWDIKSDIIEWSELLREIFGIESDQTITSSYFQQLIYPADWPEIQSRTREAFQSDTDSFFVEHRIVRPDGQIGFVWTQSYLNRDENGHVVSVYGVTQDITQRKRPELIQSILFEISRITSQFDSLEEILSLIREQLGQLLDTTNFYVALYDEESGMYHFPFAADAGDPPPWPPDPLPYSLTDYVRRNGTPMLIDTDIHKQLMKAGEATMIGAVSKVWIGTPLKTKRGVMGVMAVQNYTTEQAYTTEDLRLLTYIAENISWVIEAKQAELALRESETHYRALFEQSNDAILLYDMNGRVIKANPRVLDLLEGSEETVLHVPVGTHAVEGEKEASLDRWAQVLQNGYIPSHERLLMTQKGNLLTVEIAAVLIRDAHDTPIYVLTVLRDVTERKQAREALRKSEERLQLALDSANEGLWDWDLVTDDVYVSPRYYTLIGYEPNEFDIATSTWASLVHPEDLSLVETAFSEAAQTQDRFRTEYRMRKKSGDYIWILDRGHVVVRDENGRPLRIVGTINDITTQKQIEIALRESEQTAREFQTKLRYLHEISFELFSVENLDDLYRRAIELGRDKLEFDRIGLFLLDNDKEMLLGTYGTDDQGRIRRETQYGRRIADEPRILEIYQSGVRSRVWQNHPIYDKWVQVDTGWVGAAVLWNGNENIGYLFADNLLNKKPLRPYEADLLMIYGSILGYLISRKFTEIEINRYVDRLNVLQEIDDAILHAESPHKLARAIVQPLQRLLGCDFVRISVFDVGTDTAVTLASTITNLNTSSLIRQFESHVVGLLGQGIPYVVEQIEGTELTSLEYELLNLGMQSYIILPLRTEEELHGMITIAFEQPQHLDTEQFKIVEEVAIQLSIALRQVKLFNQVQDYATNLERLVEERTAQLAAKAHELEAFTYSVSHDLRAPLRAMDGFARMLGQLYADELPEKAQHYINRIQQNAKRMNLLIEGLLSLSRIGRRDMQVQTIDLTALATDVVHNLTADEQLDNASITIEPLGECVGDSALLRQLLVNLITNAIKYSHKEQSPQVTIRSMEQEGETVYLVQDNGVGFDMRYADKLFGVFQRLHSADEYEGTGIGLATVYRIVQRHNGRIWAEAAVNEGATFYFTLGSVNGDS